MTTTQTDRLSGAAVIAGPTNDLNAIEALTGTGIPARTGTNAWSLRTLTAPAAGITVTFGDGASGNPTLVLANDLAAVEGLATTGLAARTGTDTWAVRTIAVSGTGIAISNAGGVGGDPTITITPSAIVGAVGTLPSAAAQSDQEAGSSTTTYVSPGRQQFHPSAAKCWAFVTVATGTPTLTASYNITSITDTGLGRLTITIATDFSSANWGCLATGTNSFGAGFNMYEVKSTTQAAGSIEIDCNQAGLGAADPVAWQFAGFGDQ